MFAAEAVVTPAELVITGRSNLADGSLIDYVVWFTDSSGELTGPDLTGEMTARNGRFQAAIPSRTSEAGVFHARITFESGGDQPAIVTAKYGENGEHLSGEHVIADEDGRRIELNLTLEIQPNGSPGGSLPAPDRSSLAT